MRLHKMLAQAGVASRRAAEELIAQGRVQVNGITVTTLGTKVVESDQVSLDGKPVGGRERLTYVMLHKPAGYITTVQDTHSRRTVMDLCHGLDVRLYPVGRLDQATEGLLILTNDGELARCLLHPSQIVPKTYLVEVLGALSSIAVARLERGVLLDDGWTARAQIEAVTHTIARTRFLLTIHEGKNRQIRRMCSRVGHEVVYLKRLSIGTLVLGSLARGAYRHLTAEEVASLYRAAGRNPPTRAE
ncbi:MAG: Ribosomal large subunit pseudouridine synthase B [Firmicutes bacterium]|nr:Ribosomal large subunit pseudouridine synthase B [candidate division NPL-UPA2 bacterium]MBT9153474.1 Ribosomal large subunit pseudouridine synthase B [candidate division NPL-UPA2 bacterium]